MQQSELAIPTIDSYRLPILRRLLLILAAVYLLFVVVNLNFDRYLLALFDGAVLLYCLVLLRLSYHSKQLFPYMLLLYGCFSASQLYSAANVDTAISGPVMWSLLVPVFSYPLTGNRWGGILSAMHFGAMTGLNLWLYHGDHADLHELSYLSAAVLYLAIWAVNHRHEIERGQLMRSLQQRANCDPMTGLFNRSQLQPKFAKLNKQGSSLVLALIDLDHFKQINDQFGHPAGDAVLIHIAELLNNHTRGNDRRFRLGGEEFALMLPDTDMAGALTLLTNLQRALANSPCRFDETTIPCNFSAGLAQWPQDGNDLTALYDCADKRLYQAKRAGRDTLISD